MAGLLLGVLPARGLAAPEAPDPAAALEQVIAAAEGRLHEGDLPAAEGLYRRVLFEGWRTLTTLERLDGRLAEAKEALGNASVFSIDTPPALRSLAAAHLEMGEAGRAAEVLEELARKEPRDLETRRQLAKALSADGRVEAAVRQLDEASAPPPDDPEQAYLLGTDYLWLGKHEAAERLFARVIEARPLPQTRVLVGRTWRDAGAYGRARAELGAALREDPAVRRAHYYLGMTILADPDAGPRRLESAIAEFRAELELAPEDALANDQLGRCLLDAGRPAEALPVFEAAVRAEPRARHLYGVGRAQLALDRPAEAVASLRRALERAGEQSASPDLLQKVHYQLGLALRKTGANEEATTHLAEARRHAASSASPGDPSRADDTSPLAALSRGQRDELGRRLRASLARACFNLGVLQAQGKDGGTVERFTRAAAFFERAAGIDPEFPQLQASLGVALFNAGRFADAVPPLGRAVAASPGDAGLRRMLALSWLNTEEWSKAVPLLEADPDRATNPSLQLAHGLALVRSGRAAEAERLLAGLLAGPGESAALHVLLGEAYARQGEHAAAVASVERALRLDPAVAEAHATLALVYEEQGRLGEAEQALRAELRARPAHVPSLRRLGTLLLARGEAAEAAERLEAAARLAPDDHRVREQLGRAYQQLGRPEQARQEFEASRRLEVQP